MDRIGLLKLIANGESSRVEFKRDDCRPEDISKEMSALLNLEGGVILLGVEDDRSVSGLTRSPGEAELWVMNIVRNNLQPATNPFWTSITMDNSKVVGVVELAADSPGKPYKAKTGKEWVTYTRVGTTSIRATREEEGRLYQVARLVRYEMKAVPDMDVLSLDFDRVESYYREVLKRSVPKKDDRENWKRLLVNSGPACKWRRR